MAGFAGKRDPHRLPVGELKPRRTLYMDEEGVDRVFDESDLKPTAGESALLDRRAVEERHDAVRCFPREPYLGVPTRWPTLVGYVDKIGGTAKKRHREAARRRAARGDLRLEITGDETRRRNAMRYEVFFEECARRFQRLRRSDRKSGTRDPLQAGTIDAKRARLRWCRRGRGGADKKSAKSCRVIVVAPAGNVGKIDPCKEGCRHIGRSVRGDAGAVHAAVRPA